MSKLTDNTSGLQTILESLQNKAAGGGVETCEVEIGDNAEMSSPDPDPAYTYLNENLDIQTCQPVRGTTETVKIVKNSIVFITNFGTMAGLDNEDYISKTMVLLGDGPNNAFENGGGMTAFIVTGDGVLISST